MYTSYDGVCHQMGVTPHRPEALYGPDERERRFRLEHIIDGIFIAPHYFGSA